MTEAELSKAVDLGLPDGRLQYVIVRVVPHPKPGVVWVDAETPYNYWPFFADFGPVSLGCLYRLCTTVHRALTDKANAGKRVIVFSGPHAHKRANAVYLLAGYLLLYHGRTPEEALRPFARVNKPPLPHWHDATPGEDDFALTTLDVLRGIARAREHGFVSPFDAGFDLAEYEHYESMEHGDLNWIVEGRFVAFAGPHDARTRTPEGYITTAVDDLLPYFKAKGVAAVVRLNKKNYSERKFSDAGIAHHELYYLDGSNPPEPILQRFLQVAEGTPGALAVHCKAGLGRTGTCIGAYLMKHYRITAREAIGWMRVCRPGSVIGPQQHYLESIQLRMWEEGESFRRIRHLPLPVTGTPLHKRHVAARAARSGTATPQRQVVSPSSRQALTLSPESEAAVSRLGGLAISGASANAAAAAAAASSGGVGGSGAATPVSVASSHSSSPAGPASSSPQAKPRLSASSSAAHSTGGPLPRVNASPAEAAPSPTRHGAAAAGPAARSSALRTPGRFLGLFGGSGNSGSSAAGVPALSISASGDAGAHTPPPSSGRSAGGGGVGRTGVPAGFSAFLSSITRSGSSSALPTGAAANTSGSSVDTPRQAAEAAAVAAAATGVAGGGSNKSSGPTTPTAPLSPSSTVTDNAVGFTVSTHSMTSLGSASSGMSVAAVSPASGGVAPSTPPSAGADAAAGGGVHHSHSAAAAAYPTNGGDSSPVAATYLTRSRVRADMAAAASSTAAPRLASPAGAHHGHGSSSSVGPTAGYPTRSATAAAAAPAAAGAASPHHHTRSSSTGAAGQLMHSIAAATPGSPGVTHIPVGAQGDMLRSAKVRSPHVGGSPAVTSPHGGHHSYYGSPSAAAAAASPATSSTLRTAGSGVVAGGIASPPPRNPNFYVHTGSGTGGGAPGNGGAGAGAPGSGASASRLLSRYR